MKISNKLPNRSKRYIGLKKFERLLSNTLAKEIQKAIDDDIIEHLKKIASEQIDETVTITEQ